MATLLGRMVSGGGARAAQSVYSIECVVTTDAIELQFELQSATTRSAFSTLTTRHQTRNHVALDDLTSFLNTHHHIFSSFNLQKHLVKESRRSSYTNT